MAGEQAQDAVTLDLGPRHRIGVINQRGPERRRREQGVGHDINPPGDAVGERNADAPRGDEASVSNGSLRHFFREGKLDLAAATYVRISQTVWQGVFDDLRPPTSRGAVEFSVSLALNRLWQSMTADAGRAAAYFELEPLLLRSNAAPAVRTEIQRRVEAFAAWHESAPQKLLRPQAPELAFAFTFGPTLAMLSDWALRGSSLGDMTLPTPCWKIAAAML